MYRHLLLLSCLLCTVFACQKNEPKAAWRLIYHHDAQGQAIAGSKAALLEAVRAGLPVRLGWGRQSSRDTSRSIEHVSDIHFLSIVDGEDVFGQTVSIVGQAPRRDNDTIKVFFRPSNHWTMMAGTNGFTTGLMRDYLADTLVNSGRERQQALRWYVLYDGQPLSQQAVSPLWSE